MYHQQISYIARSILLENHLRFSMMMFAHLKRPVAVNLLNNFKATLASYHLYCMFAVSKLNHHATLHATLAVSK